MQYVDPTGHDGLPSNWWNPFSYNTLQGTLHLTLEGVAGASFDIGGAVNWKAVKDSITHFDPSYLRNQFEFAVVVSTSGTFGAEVEGSGVISLTGTNDTVSELINDNVSTVLDGEVPVNVSVCWEVCLGGSATFEPGKPESEQVNSVSWSGGLGYGGELGVDLVTVTDWIVYGTNNATNPYVTVNKPPDVGEMFREAYSDAKTVLKKIWTTIHPQ